VIAPLELDEPRQLYVISLLGLDDLGARGQASTSPSST
jgi:hypothetical protein